MAHVHLSILISLFFWRATSTLTKRYAYAPDGERIWKGTNGAVTRTPFAHYEVDVASNTVTRYYATARSEDREVRSEQCPHGCICSLLTSLSSFLSGAAANLFATARTYTRQQADGTGLMYYHARYYDPAAGQFISPDTLVPDPTNVMDYQRYAYARGNPLRYSDPTGHFSEDDIPLLCVD